MTIKLVAAAIALALAAVAPASAATLVYTLSGVGSGIYTDGAVVTPFSDVDFTINAIIDTSIEINDPGVAFGYKIISASQTALGVTRPITDATDSYALFLEGKNAGSLLIGSPPFSAPPVFYSSAFVGYNGVSDLGPVSFVYSDSLGTLDPTFPDGADASFTSITDGLLTVSAAPEPATWAMMLLGLGGVGLAMRWSHRKPLRAVATA